MATITYDEFRTGLTFADVRRMLWVDNPDPSTWVRKTRRAILRHWRALKEAMWATFTGGLSPRETYEVDVEVSMPEGESPELDATEFGADDDDWFDRRPHSTRDRGRAEGAYRCAHAAPSVWGGVES